MITNRCRSKLWSVLMMINRRILFQTLVLLISPESSSCDDGERFRANDSGDKDGINANGTRTISQSDQALKGSGVALSLEAFPEISTVKLGSNSQFRGSLFASVTDSVGAGRRAINDSAF